MQKPLALVVVGGMALAPVLILLVMPVLIDRFSRHVSPEERGPHGHALPHHPAQSGEQPA